MPCWSGPAGDRDGDPKWLSLEAADRGDRRAQLARVAGRPTWPSQQARFSRGLRGASVIAAAGSGKSWSS